MKSTIATVFTVLATFASAAFLSTAWAGADLVAYPENYASRFVRFTTVDQAPQKRVRFMYVNPEALAAAKAGQPAPYGTVLVMEDHRVELDAAGNPRTDVAGRLIPTSEVFAIFVQRKERGWGAGYPESLRNGEWEYASFTLDGRHREGQSYTRCFECHKENAASDDFMFTFADFLKKIGK